MSLSISEDLMSRMWPAGGQKIPGLRAGIAASSARVFAKYGITTTLQARTSWRRCRTSVGQVMTSSRT
jgi:hypothetical protein